MVLLNQSVLMLASSYVDEEASREGFRRDIDAERHAESDSAAHRLEGASWTYSLERRIMSDI